MTEEESEKIWNVEDALFSFDGSDMKPIIRLILIQ